MERQVLDGVKVCQDQAMATLQDSLNGIIAQRVASIRPTAHERYLGGIGEERLMSTHMFLYREDDLIDVWESLVIGALHEDSKIEAPRLIYLSDRLSDLPQQKAELREMFENLFHLALMRRYENAELFVFKVGCEVEGLRQGKTKIGRTSMGRFFDLAKRVVLAAFEDNVHADPEVAARSLGIMAAIGDDEMAKALNKIASDASCPSFFRDMADRQRALMRVRDELDSAREMKERYLALYPENSGQWLYISMIYTAIERVLGSNGDEDGMDRVDLMSALRQLAGFGTGSGNLAALFNGKDAAAADTHISSDLGIGAVGIDFLADLRSDAEEVFSDGFPRISDDGLVPLSGDMGIAPNGGNILESISYDIENALVHALRSKDKCGKTIAAHGLSRIGNGHVDYVLGKMLERYGKESGVGRDVAMILWKRAGARMLKEMDFEDIAGRAGFGNRNKPQSDKHRAGNPDKRRTIV